MFSTQSKNCIPICQYKLPNNPDFTILKRETWVRIHQPFPGTFSLFFSRWLGGEHVGLVTWWLYVQDRVEANFLSGLFSALTTAEACERSSQWLWKETCVSTGVRKPGNVRHQLP